MHGLEDKYNILRRKLDSVGYHQPLSFGSMVLVDNLLNDILHYKSEYTSFKDITNEVLQQLSVLKLKGKPFVQECKHLQNENNYLKLEVIQEQGGFQEILNDLKTHVLEFQKAYSDLELVNQENLIRIGELEEELSFKNKELIKYEGVKDYVKEKNKFKHLKLPLNKDERPKHLLKIAEEHKINQWKYHKSTQTKLRTSISDKRADLNAGRTEKSCQTVSVYEQDIDCKFVGKIEEQYKQNKSYHISQSFTKNGGEDIVPLQSAFEKIKAERDYYSKEYHLLQDRIFQMFRENCSPEQAFCIEKIKHCQGDHLWLFINRIEELISCKRNADHIKETELQDMIMTLQRERVVLMLKCERVEQKIQEIKNHYQNLSSGKSKMISKNNFLQKCIIKKDEELRSAISTQQKTEVKLNNALLNLVTMSTENDCLKDKIKQKDDYIKNREKDLVSQANSIKTLSGLKQKAETEVISLRKKADESENELKELKEELSRSSYEIDRIVKENEHLVITVEKLNNHVRQLHEDLDLRKHRIKDMKREIHHYISEVRRVEEAIESKEQELQRILETYSIASDEETFVLGKKQQETLERNGKFVTEYFENITHALSSIEEIEHKVDEIQELQV
ncbi:uncharacterized protein [Halyomorpha halys]|uniref:uncharacterized protein isoform X2 n=1 Tax=Halyomorpha halys TaxID=286706 RepID=UPI0034D1704F